MKIIFLTIVIMYVMHQQDARRISYSIGPQFLSKIEIRQKIYYNNLGTRIDCLAKGDPIPSINWFRKINIDDQLLIPVQASELIDLFQNGSLFIRPFHDYIKSIHAGLFICQAKNAVGSILSLPIQLKPQIYDAYEIEVKNPYGFLQSSVIISCEISPPLASSYLKIIGWLERVNDHVTEPNLQIQTKYNLLPNGDLIIHNLTKSDDHRNYACIVRNQIDNQTKQSRFKTLHVRDRSPFGPELSVLNNTEYHARSSDVIELPCGIASLSNNAQISWWKNGLPIVEKIYENSLILHISSTSIDDTGIYTCQVDDEPSGKMTSMMTLTVTVPIQCQLTIPQINLDAGSNSQLICTTNMHSNSTIQWQWFHNSLPLYNQFNRYSINNATRQHMGMYQCCFIPMSSSLNGCCAQTQIRIINSPPVVLRTDQKQMIITEKNRSHDLNCTIYADPLPEINIYKNGQRLDHLNPIEYLPSGDVFLHYPITVSNINDTGLYECLAENSLGSIIFSKEIHLEHQKPFIQPFINQSIHSDEQFTIRCYASGQPNLHLQWIDPTTKQILNTSSSSPILFTSKISQSNMYTCHARNPLGEMSSSIFLTVENPARIQYFTGNQTIRIHQRLLVSCLVEGDQPLEIIFKSPTRTQRYENEKNISLIINQIEMLDSGFYECHVKNSHSEQRIVSEILVQSRPEKIENIFLENTQQIYWMQPFDGNSPIFRYLLRVQYRQGFVWSEEMIITLEEINLTSYSFENIFSKCLISVIIQAVNQIGISIPSDPFYIQMDNQKLPIAPYNLTARNISSKSVVITWEYPSMNLCNKSMFKFRIEIIDQSNRATIHLHQSKTITINQLKSFTFYTVIIYAITDYGSSIQSKPLTIQTMEDVPLAMVSDLTGRLVNSSMISITWAFSDDIHTRLHGQFRTFLVSIYENFNMSTLQTIETIQTHFILDKLRSFSRYFISVSICNHFDCGPSSSVIDLQTPSKKNSAFSLSSSVTRTIHRPSSIQTKIHYSTFNEIGLKIIYPSDIVENIVIVYQISNSSLKHQLNISPPIFNIRLMNLSCGNSYEFMIYAKNHIGSSAIEFLEAKTEGSVPTFIESADMFTNISHDSLILNINQWLIYTCPILSYEIEYHPLENLSQIESNRYLPPIEFIRIDHLQSNTDYQLNVKISSEAGETFQRISFRTNDSRQYHFRQNQQMIFIMVCMASFVLTFALVFLILKKFDIFHRRTTRLRPVIYSNKYSRSSSKNSQRRSDSFVSEDSQGNINPYAVTHYKNYQTDIRPSLTRSGRYFRPIILESSFSNHQNPPLVSNDLSTVSISTESGVLSSFSIQNNRQYSLV